MVGSSNFQKYLQIRVVLLNKYIIFIYKIKELKNIKKNG